MQQSTVLPFGFARGSTSLNRLKDDLSLLYRVHCDEAHTEYTREHGFVAGQLCQDDQVPSCCFTNLLPPRRPAVDRTRPAYAEVANYLDNTLVSNRLIWTTMSLTVALRWADVQSRSWKDARTNTRIAVIDAAKVVDNAYTAIELLERRGQVTPRRSQEEEEDHSKRYNFANALQVVFVLNSIPSSAILSIKDWKSIEAELPPWFQDPDQTPLFVQLDPPLSPKDARIRLLFDKIRTIYKPRCNGPMAEDAQGMALIAARFLLDRKDYEDNARSVSLLCELAWYFLTFPIAPWGSQRKNATPAAGYDFPTATQRARFDHFVKCNVGHRGTDGADVDDLAAMFRRAPFFEAGTA